jgi:hypothetical protein
MTSPNHYRSNLRDIAFNLFEVLDVGRTSLGHAPFGSLDEATARETLRAGERLATTELAASFAETDRDPPILDAEGNVILPAGLKRSLAAYYDADWHLLEIPERLGGVGAPPTIVWANFETTVGANPSMAFYLLSACVSRVIDRLGTAAQKERFVPRMLERKWGAAMVLTEPDAGSDVGAARAKARHVGGDVWEIEGTKRFITAGDYDAAENIVHMVLARPEGGPSGTKGLSMFIVPKIWVNEDGSLGDKNNLVCTKIEKKMGLKGSVTCEMAYGTDGPTRGLLVGDKHDGMRQMFHIIEYARMAVGIKSMATLSTAYLNALAYTKDRVQGPDLARAADKASPRVKILAHPDVRRMLMLQKAHAEGMRALVLFTAWTQDQVEIAGGHAAKSAAEWDALNDMLLPLVKGYCSDRCYDLLGVALQCFGGSGYVQDYPMEQYIRDQKIDTLYEGTTHIQALDLFFRKIARDGGATLQGLLGRVRATLAESAGGPALAEEREALAAALGDVEGIFMAMMGKVSESVYHVGLHGNAILHALAELTIGWLLVRHAAVALAKKDAEGTTPDDRAFYEGKIASTRFFCHEVLPGIALTRRRIEKSRLDLMSLPEEAF